MSRDWREARAVVDAAIDALAQTLERRDSLVRQARACLSRARERLKASERRISDLERLQARRRSSDEM
ncbi:MAG: hypothetical protein JOZ41_03810 [Chloroflexi bacterium]|nr:hypothetical protein [Chloroflexota bacterium]